MNHFIEKLSNTKASDEFNQSLKQTKFQKFSSYLIVRMVLIGLAVLIPVAFTNVLSIYVIDRFTGVTETILDGLRHLLSIILIFMAYRFYCRKIENREAKEFSLPRSFLELFSGSFVGGFLVALIVAVLALNGMYQIISLKPASVLVKGFYIFYTGALFQEIFFRLVLFKIIEEKLGTWLAITAVALIFALAHVTNPNTTLMTSIYMFLSDFLFGAGFVLTRRIWFVWGMHGAWNFIQDGVFGMSNSGIDQFPSWIIPKVQGPVWLTGGAYGIEASVTSLVLSIMGGIILLKYAVQSKQMVLPVWKKYDAQS